MAGYLKTPLTVDDYSRSMAEAYDENDLVGISTLGQSFFGRNGSQTLFAPDSLDVDIEIMRGNEKTAALVPRGTVSRKLGDTQKDTKRDQWTQFNRTFPLIEEASTIQSNKLLSRQFAEMPYSGRTKKMRLITEATKNHREHVRRIIRAYERLAWTSLLTGKMPAIFDTTDTDLIYDFRRNAALSVTLGTQWTTTTADAPGNLGSLADLIRIHGKVNADFCIMGVDAFNAFLKNETVLARADNRRYFTPVEINDKMMVPPTMAHIVASGGMLRGKTITPNGYELYIFTYIDTWDDASGTATKFMPAGKVLMGSSKARADRYFGPDEQLPEIDMRRAFYSQMFGIDITAQKSPGNVKEESHVYQPGMIYFDAYPSADWKNVTVRAQSAPIFVTTQTDAWGVIENAA